MQKVTLKINETLKYQREVKVLIPDDMDEEQLNSALDQAQRQAEHVDDIIHGLRKFGIEQNGSYDDSLDSPYNAEVECDDYDFEK